MPYWRYQFWKRAWWVLLAIVAPERKCPRFGRLTRFETVLTRQIAYIPGRDWVFARNLKHDMAKHLQGLMHVVSADRADDIEMGRPRPNIPHANISETSGESRTSVPLPIPKKEGRLKMALRTLVYGTTEPRPKDRGQRQPSQRYHKWTRTHNYFALMGGFVLDNSKMSINPFENFRERSTITASTLCAIARATPDSIPDISKRAILDKSKANGIGKLLLCLQAGWFGAQTVGRLATKDNPISLLELNVLLHALCCLFILRVWWFKPLDIEEPDSVDASKTRNQDLYAHMCVNRRLYCRPHSEKVNVGHGTKAFLTRSGHRSGRVTATAIQNSNTYSFVDVDVTQRVDERSRGFHRNKTTKKLRLYNDQICFGFHLVVQADDPSDVYVELKWADLVCLRVAQGLKPENRDNVYAEFVNRRLTDLFVDCISTLDSTDDSLKRLEGTATREQSARALWNLDRVATVGFMAAAAV